MSTAGTRPEPTATREAAGAARSEPAGAAAREVAGAARRTRTPGGERTPGDARNPGDERVPTPLAGLPPLGPARPLTAVRRIRLEIRKMVDTRAGSVLLAIILAAAPVSIVVWMLATDSAGHTVENLVGAGCTAAAILLPVIAALNITSEWGQRSILTTFALDPRRGRVLAAKVLASQVLMLAVVALCLATAFTLAAVYDLDVPDGDQVARSIAGALAACAIYTLMGSAWGALTLNSPLALVSIILAPQVVANLVSLLGDRVADVGPYLTINVNLGPLSAGEVENWGHMIGSVLIWVCLPLLLGLVRVLRKDTN